MNMFDTRLPSATNHDFSKVPQVELQRSTFKRPSTHKTAFNAGKLIPIFIDEVLPGDTFNMRVSSVTRLTTPIVPFMDNLYLDYFFFFVPNRLVWENWQKFMGEKEDPESTTEYEIPWLDFESESVSDESIFDYMGLMLGTYDNTHVSALPLRCYNRIFNDWFRDQNLQAAVPCPKDDGPDAWTNYGLLYRAKRHDYFTSCLPWPQKGDGVELPLGTTAPVKGNGQTLQFSDGVNNFGIRWDDGNNKFQANQYYGTASQPTNINDVNQTLTDNATISLITSANSGLIADLSQATAVTINSLREAFQLQRLLERDALGGTRYIEILKSHFGVSSPDARLQRPEYLGGGTAPIEIHSIPQTSQTSTTPQGTLAAYGYAKASGIGFSKAFVEHGYIIGLVCVRADLTYQQGINKMWTRSTKYDFYWPALAHLGEQPVLQREIYYTDVVNDDTSIFGYQERWAEYRYRPSQISGKLRSTLGANLDKWHLAQEFYEAPNLNADFIAENPPVNRVVAVTSQPQFVTDMYFDLTCSRVMPMYSIPGMVDHF